MNNDLISRDALRNVILNDRKLDGANANWEVNRILVHIDKAPTVHGIVAYVERPKGEWIKDESSSIAYRCSNCEVLQHWSPIKNGKYNFCPNCGADTRGEDK